MVDVAGGWELYERTHSAVSLGLVGLVQIVPAVLLAFLLGPMEEPRIENLYLCNYPLSWVASPKLKVGRQPISLKRLGQWPVITYSSTTDPHRAVMAWLITWGEAKTQEYIRALLRNGMMPRKGHTLQTQLLCAGEFKVGVELHAYQVMQAKREKGCPIDMVFADPAPGSTGSHIGIARAAPHPHAAALFVDFVLGDAGAKIVADSGRIPTRKGTKARYDELSNPQDKGVKVVIALPDDAHRLEATAEKLIKEIMKSQ